MMMMMMMMMTLTNTTLVGRLQQRAKTSEYVASYLAHVAAESENFAQTHLTSSFPL
jgi:hypothetical protein